VDDGRRPDPTGQLLEDYVRTVSERVVVPEFTPGSRPGPRRRHEVPGGARLVAVVVAAAAVVVVIALVVAYGPRSARIGPGPAPATQPTPAPTSTTAPTSSTTAPTSTTLVIAGTRTVTYEPFTTTGIDPRLTVTSQVTGTCIRYSRGTPERFYFRCFGSGSGIYDPCFAGPQSTMAPLVCPSGPTSNDVVEFTVTSVTADEPPSSSPTMTPWAMQLSSGQICLLVSAAWSGLGPYSCQPAASQPAAADCHIPAAAQPFWTTACQSQETAVSPFTTRDVATVWF
jgi:hypothetical protein